MPAASAEHAFIHIAQRNHLDRGNLDQAEQIDFSVPTAAD